MSVNASHRDEFSLSLYYTRLFKEADLPKFCCKLLYEDQLIFLLQGKRPKDKDSLRDDVLVSKGLYTAYYLVLSLSDFNLGYLLLDGIHKVIHRSLPSQMHSVVDFEIHRATGLALFRENRHKMALKELKAALISCPKVQEDYVEGRVEVLLLIVEVYWSLQRWSDAVKYSRQAVEISGRSNNVPVPRYRIASPLLSPVRAVVFSYLALANSSLLLIQSAGRGAATMKPKQWDEIKKYYNKALESVYQYSSINVNESRIRGNDETEELIRLINTQRLCIQEVEESKADLMGKRFSDLFSRFGNLAISPQSPSSSPTMAPTPIANSYARPSTSPQLSPALLQTPPLAKEEILIPTSFTSSHQSFSMVRAKSAVLDNTLSQSNVSLTRPLTAPAQLSSTQFTSPVSIATLYRSTINTADFRPKSPVSQWLKHDDKYHSSSSPYGAKIVVKRSMSAAQNRGKQQGTGLRAFNDVRFMRINQGSVKIDSLPPTRSRPKTADILFLPSVNST